jgi:protein TonB
VPVQVEGTDVPQEHLSGSGAPPVDDPDVHLQHLLTPADIGQPWFRSFFKNIQELINPPKLPPLEVTSKPVPIEELKMYAGNEATAGISSLLIHVGVIGLLVFLGSLKSVQKAVKDQVTFIAPNLSEYLAPKKDVSKGGGGGGAKAPLDASKGKLPKIAPKQFTPPKVDPIEHPKLPVPAGIIAPPDVPNIVATDYGDPLSRLNSASNGLGVGGGIVSGKGGGVGPGTGNGFGPGSGGGFGGGVYHIGGGVSAPTVLFKVEPEYSEEARKAKWQGTVVLSLVVDEAGRPQNLKVLRSLGLGLDQKAIEAVEKWKFKPGVKDGKPVAVQATIEVNFRLL